jgi:hypothetical protein
VLHFNGREMTNNAEKLSAIGVHDGDLVMMVASNNRYRFGSCPPEYTSVWNFLWGLNSCSSVWVM